MDQKNRMNSSRFTNTLLPLLGRHEKSLVPRKEGFISSNLASTVKFSSSLLKNNKEEERTTETANLVSRLFLSETNLMAYPFLLYIYTGCHVLSGNALSYVMNMGRRYIFATIL